MLAAGFVEVRSPAEHLRRFNGPDGAVLIPVGHPREVESDFAEALDHAERECAKVERATTPPATVEEFLRGLESGDGEPSEGDVADAQPTAPGPTVANLQAELAAERARADLCDAEAVSQRQRADAAEEQIRLLTWSNGELQTLAAAASAVDPRRTAAEAEAKEERRRANAAERDAAGERVQANEWLTQLHDAQAQLNAIADALDAEPERSPAWDGDGNPVPLPRRVEVALMPDPVYERELRKSLHAVEAELFEVDRALHTLGAYGTGPTKERLLQVLTPEDRRAILEFDAAEARMDLARLRARRLIPAPPERVAELVAKVATLDARIAALDAEKVQQ
jgi:hypothetical protein